MAPMQKALVALALLGGADGLNFGAKLQAPSVKVPSSPGAAQAAKSNPLAVAGAGVAALVVASSAVSSLTGGWPPFELDESRRRPDASQRRRTASRRRHDESGRRHGRSYCVTTPSRRSHDAVTTPSRRRHDAVTTLSRRHHDAVETPDAFY